MTRALVALVVTAALSGCTGSDGAATYRAADLRTGAEVSVTDLRGAPVVLVSWTTWCTGCDELLSGLQAFADSPAAQGIHVVAVNLNAGDATDEISAKIARHGLETGLWRDRVNQFKGAFGALGVPTTVLLDAEGRVAATFPGAVDFEAPAFLESLQQVLAEPS